MDNILIAFAIFFSGIIFIRLFHRKAIRQLSTEQKAKLVDYSSGVAVWRMLPLLLTFLGFVFFMYLKPSVDVMKTGLFIYLALIWISFIISNIIVQRKYNILDFPSSFLRTVLFCSIASIVLVTALIIFITFPFLKNHS